MRTIFLLSTALLLTQCTNYDNHRYYNSVTDISKADVHRSPSHRNGGK